MKNKFRFSSSAAIKIQGSRVLRLFSQTQNSINFHIIGFDDFILIEDYRINTKSSIEQAKIDNNPLLITHQFNKPANISIKCSESNSLIVTLTDTDQEDMEYIMWVNVGLTGTLPIYDYLFHRIATLENDEFALFAVFRRSSHARSILPTQLALSDKIQFPPELVYS